MRWIYVLSLRAAVIILICLFIPIGYLTAEIISSNDSDKINKSIELGIECHSGTPPVLEFVLKDPKDVVRKIDFDFDDDGLAELELTKRYPKNVVVFRGVPFRKPGLYHFTAFIHTENNIYLRKYELAFTKFTWGKNNFNFANDGEFEDKISFVSRTILDWGKDRFGDLNNRERLILLYIMYSLYKGSIGRCYGFSGGELLYIKNPDLLPWPYNYAFEIPEIDPRIIRDMDFVQNDIVFTNFVNKRIVIDKKQNNVDLKRQLRLIESTIKGNVPIILGYVSRKMHHSMVVYGYWRNLYRNKTTLLTANNWERNQNNNIYSEDAENIVVTMKGNTHRIIWHDLTYNRYRYPDILFGIEPRAKYILKKDEFRSLIDRYEKYIIEKNVNILMIEKTETAYVVDREGRKVGFDKPDTYYGIYDVKFKKIDYNYLFEIPAKRDVTLVLKKRRFNSIKSMYKKVNIFIISPGCSLSTGEYYDVKIFDNKESYFKIAKGRLVRRESLEGRNTIDKQNKTLRK